MVRTMMGMMGVCSVDETQHSEFGDSRVDMITDRLMRLMLRRLLLRDCRGFWRWQQKIERMSGIVMRWRAMMTCGPSLSARLHRES